MSGGYAGQKFEVTPSHGTICVIEAIVPVESMNAMSKGVRVRKIQGGVAESCTELNRNKMPRPSGIDVRSSRPTLS